MITRLSPPPYSLWLVINLVPVQYWETIIWLLLIDRPSPPSSSLQLVTSREPVQCTNNYNYYKFNTKISVCLPVYAPFPRSFRNRFSCALAQSCSWEVSNHKYLGKLKKSWNWRAKIDLNRIMHIRSRKGTVKSIRHFL